MKKLLLFFLLPLNIISFCQDTLSKQRRDSLTAKIDSFYKAHPEYYRTRPYGMTILRKPTKEERERIKNEATIKKIDSTVKANDRIEYFYRADSISKIYDKDSNVLAASSAEFFYTDKKGKDLIKVDELSFIKDTSSTIFYYSKRQIIKIDYHLFIAGKTAVLELYYDKGKLIGEDRKGDMIIDTFYSPYMISLKNI